MTIFTARSVALVTLALSLLATLTAAGGKLLLFDNADFANAASAATIFTGPAQRCYSFDCHRGSASSIKWEDMQDDSWIVFFENLGCTGKSMKGQGPDGQLALGGGEMDNRVSSFMIWESGMYPTRGLRDVCREELAAFMNHSLVAGVDSGVGDSNSGESGNFTSVVGVDGGEP